MKTPYSKNRFGFAAVLFLSVMPYLSALGASETGASSSLHVAGGIAMPGTSTAVLTNPAGVVGASTAFVGQMGAPEVWERGTYRAGLQTGGGVFGAAGGLELRDRAANDTLAAYYGMAVGVSAFSFGLGGKTAISNGNGSSLNAGALFTAAPLTTLGLTVVGLDDGVNEFGLGLAFGMNGSLAFVVDAAIDDDFENPELKPGIKVGTDLAALTVSYGTGSRIQFSDGITAGGCYRFSGGNLLEVQYNTGGDLSKYFAALTIGI